jgi:DNA repair protein SbcC/Rad50
MGEQKVLIRRITISNFQAHKKLTLSLDQFTAIIGPSSSGKSAILRALSWLCYGNWDATYPTDPEQETAIAIQLDNGDIWARFRIGKRNTAILRKPGEKPLVYQDFGDIIPGLLEELNVRTIKLGTTRVNLNFSMQDDPIFMVHESKPAKAQWIGRLYGAHIINHMLRIMAKDKRAIEADKKAEEDEESRLTSELAKYEGLEEQAKEIEKTGSLLSGLQELIECQAQLASILQDREAIKRGSHFLNADTDWLRISISRLEDLRAAQDEALSVRREEWAISQSRCLNANTDGIRADLSALAEARARLDEHRSIERELGAVRNEHDKVTERLAGIAPELDGLRKSIKDNLFTDGRCPLCSSKPRKLDIAVVTANIKELVRSV